MAQYKNPLEGLLAGLGSGLQQGVGSAFAAGDERRKEQRQAEQERQRAIREFSARDALNREGSAQELTDVFMQGIKPQEEQRADSDALASLMSGPAMRSMDPPAWAGSNAQPRMMEVPSQLKSARELFGTAGLERDPQGNEILGADTTSVGIPQISTRLRQLQAQRLIPQTQKALGTRQARTGGRGPSHDDERRIARDVLTDFAKTREIKEDILPDLLRKDEGLRQRFTAQLIAAYRSEYPDRPIPSPERLSVLVTGVAGPFGK